MFNPTYLQLSRNGIFYLRWPLPRRFHPSGKPTTVKVSLRVREPREALKLSRVMVLIADKVLHAGAMSGMRYDEIRRLLKEHFQRRLNDQTEQMGVQGRLSLIERQALQNSIAIAEDAVKGPYPLSFVKPDDTELMNGMMQKLGVHFPSDSQQYQWLNSELKLSFRDYAKAVLKYDAGLDSYDFTRSEPRSEHSSIGTDAFSLSLLAEGYTTEKKRGEHWAAKTELEKGDHINLLFEIIGEKTDITQLTAKDAKRVKDTLLGYPKNRFKNEKTRKKTLSEVLDLPDVAKLHIKTINKYLQTYSDMFGWANRNGYVETNLFAGLTLKQSKRKDDGKRRAFSNAQIIAIIEAISGNKPDLVRKPYQKWGPLLGIYTGARLNEIAQLHLKDVRQEGGIWCLDLNDEDEGKSLKASASRRLVPVHARLIELGFIEHVDHLKQQGEVKLFPDFRYCPKNGWGRSLGRWFNETLLPKLEMKRSELVFHSLRHTVVTRLMQADVQEPVVKALVGHAQEGVTQQNYFQQGYTIQQLDDALAKLQFSAERPSGDQ